MLYRISSLIQYIIFIKNRVLFICFLLFLGACLSKPVVGNKSRKIIDPLITNIHTRNIDTNIYTKMYSTVEVPWMNLEGSLFTLSGNLCVFQKDSTLLLAPLDTGRMSLQSWSKNAKDTLVRINVIVTADSYTRATHSIYNNINYPYSLDSFQDAFFHFTRINKPFPASIKPLSIENNIPFDNKRLLGKISIIDCWYFGCPPCRAEIEQLEQIIPRYRTDTGINFLSFFRDSAYIKSGTPVFYNEYYEVIKWRGKTLKSGIVTEWSSISYPASHFYNLKIFEKFLTRSLYPQTYIIDKQGIVRYLFEGAAENIGEQIERQIRLWQGFIP